MRDRFETLFQVNSQSRNQTYEYQTISSPESNDLLPSGQVEHLRSGFRDLQVHPTGVPTNPSRLERPRNLLRPQEKGVFLRPEPGIILVHPQLLSDGPAVRAESRSARHIRGGTRVLQDQPGAQTENCDFERYKKGGCSEE